MRGGCARRVPIPPAEIITEMPGARDEVLRHGVNQTGSGRPRPERAARLKPGAQRHT